MGDIWYGEWSMLWMKSLWGAVGRTKEQRGVQAHTSHSRTNVLRLHTWFACVCVCGSNLCGIENFGRFDILTLVDKIYANLYMHGGLVNMPAGRVIRFICMLHIKIWPHRSSQHSFWGWIGLFVGLLIAPPCAPIRHNPKLYPRTHGSPGARVWKRVEMPCWPRIKCRFMHARDEKSANSKISRGSGRRRICPWALKT